MGLSAPSPALGRPVPYALYRPEAPPRPGERWPVLYLLHGLGDDERAWAELGRVEEILDGLIADGRIAPLLVVMPAAGRSWYVDNPDPGGEGLMARALTADLPTHIEATEPALTCRGGRAVGGLSMGGYGALLYALDQPGRYAAAFSLSGAVMLPLAGPPDERTRAELGMLDVAFGNPLDWRRYNRHNLILKVPAYAAERNRTPLFLTLGTEDLPEIVAGTESFRRELATHGVATTFRRDPGGHDWDLWTAELGPALVWLDARWSTGCGRGPG